MSITYSFSNIHTHTYHQPRILKPGDRRFWLTGLLSFLRLPNLLEYIFVYSFLMAVFEMPLALWLRLRPSLLRLWLFRCGKSNATLSPM